MDTFLYSCKKPAERFQLAAVAGMEFYGTVVSVIQINKIKCQTLFCNGVLS